MRFGSCSTGYENAKVLNGEDLSLWDLRMFECQSKTSESCRSYRM